MVRIIKSIDLLRLRGLFIDRRGAEYAALSWEQLKHEAPSAIALNFPDYVSLHPGYILPAQE
jgi:hypothetical protein